LKILHCLIVVLCLVTVTRADPTPAPTTQAELESMLASLGAPAAATMSPCTDCDDTYWKKFYAAEQARKRYWYFNTEDPIYCENPALDNYTYHCLKMWNAYLKEWSDRLNKEMRQEWEDCVATNCQPSPPANPTFPNTWPPSGPYPAVDPIHDSHPENPVPDVDCSTTNGCKICASNYQWGLKWIFDEYCRAHEACAETPWPGDCIDSLDTWFVNALQDLKDVAEACFTAQSCSGHCTGMNAWFCGSSNLGGYCNPDNFLLTGWAYYCDGAGTEIPPPYGAEGKAIDMKPPSYLCPLYYCVEED
jgi:hypothetical protein